MNKWIITTETGSKYLIRQDGTQWWFSADNVPNAQSTPLQDGEWEIKPPEPWPPTRGMRLWIVSKYVDQPGHPDRIPGGGKHTSQVVSVTSTGVV